MAATKRLLLIEDNHVDALTVLSCIRNVDDEWEVIECQNLRDGLTALDQYSFQLILLDLGLPDSDALDGLQAITRRVDAVPIIIITGNDDNEVAIQALKEGAQDYIVKGSYSTASLERSMRYAIERKKHENKLRELHIALTSEQRSNHMQSSFLSMISHQFRTPLAIINGSQSMLKHAIASEDTEKIQQELQRSHEAIGRITELVDSATRMCDIESGSMHFNLSAFPFRALVENLWSRYTQICRGREMNININDAPHFIVGDPSLIHMALTQLINNAIRYSDSNTPIKLDAYIEDSSLCIQIIDQGQGIDPQHIDHIFDQFYRGSSDNTGPVGVGLGLSLVHNIVELHQGNIYAESELGTGTIMKMELPLQMMSSLVIDDNMINRTVAAESLRGFGYDVAETSSPIDALGMVREDAVNFILLDWHMPEMNGLEFIRLVRDAGKHIPIFLYSAQEEDGHSLALQNGADDFLPKPFSKEKLQKLLQKHHLLSYNIDSYATPTIVEEAC